MATATLVISRRLNASRDQVFAAWTDPEIMQQWYAPGQAQVAEVECDPVVGGRFRVVMKGPEGQTYITSGTYREVVPGEKLVHSWSWEGSDSETQVTIELKALEGGVTELTLTHELFPDADTRDLHNEGWTESISKLERLMNEVGIGA